MSQTRKITAIALVAFGAAACNQGLTDAGARPEQARTVTTSSTCTQSFNTVLIGPHSNQALIIVDPSFEYGCPNWVFPDTFSTRTTGAALDGSWFAQMKPYTSFSRTRFYQDINLVNPANGKRALPAAVGFAVNTVSSPGTTSFDQWTAKLINAGTGTVLQTFTVQTGLVAPGWKGYTFNLTQPVSYYPDVVRLQFDGTVFDRATRFQFDQVTFWAVPQY